MRERKVPPFTSTSSPSEARTTGAFPRIRMRRNRAEPWRRRLVSEHRLTVDDLMWPIFVREGTNAIEPVPSMPGVERLTIDRIPDAAAAAAELGIPAVALFPQTPAERKTTDGAEAMEPGESRNRAIRAMKSAVPGHWCDLRCRPRSVYQPWP